MAKKSPKNKAIGQSVGAANSASSTPVGANQQTSLLATSNMSKSLHPKEAYELSIAVRSCVQARATNVSKAKVRLYHRDSGDEILEGDLYNLIRRPSKWTSTQTFINDLVTWYDIAGNFFVSLGVNPATNGVESMVLLDPFAVRYNPINAVLRDQVTQWAYTNRMGYTVQIPSNQIVHGKNFNPHSDILGLSPLVTGVNEVASSYQVNRFNRQFLENGAAGSLVFRFPKGTKKQDAKEFVESWSMNHSPYHGTAFKMAGIIGDEIQIEDISSPPKDAQYVQLQQLNDERIDRLYKVPASESGNYSKTRFDSIEFEQESFAENTLMPLMQSVSEVLQIQLVDRHFPDAGRSTKKARPVMGKAMRKVYEEAMDSRPESDVVILLDPDTLPIMSKLQRHKADYALKLREAFDLSANEAAEYVGIDLAPRKERDDIYIPSGRVNISPKDQSQKPQYEPQEAEPTQDTPDQEEPVSEDVKALQKAARQYRSVVLAAVAEGKGFDKATAINLLGKSLSVQVHKDYLKIKEIIRSEGDRMRLAKDYLNQTYSKAAIKILSSKE